MTPPAPFSRTFEPPPDDPEAQAVVTRGARARLPLQAQSPPRDLLADLVGVPEPLRDAQDALDGVLRLQAREDSAVAQAAAAGGDPTAAIVGVAVGKAGIGPVAEGPAVGAAPGTPVLTVYTSEPTDPALVRAMLESSMGARAAAHVPLRVVHSGVFRVSSQATMERPAPGGVSGHHLRSPAGTPAGMGATGTLGCLARGRTAPRDGRLLVLSNNHVLTNSNTAFLNDCIVQPSPGDGGSCPAHQIAILENYLPVVPGGTVPNYVDCATGWAWPDRVRKEIVYEFAGAKNYFRIAGTPPDFGNPQEIDRGTWMGKSGRSTGLTYGYVNEFPARTVIEGHWGGVASKALFHDALVVTGPTGPFSQPGDSGAVVFTADGTNRPVGLVMGTSNTTGMSIVCRMDAVMSALDIVLEA